MNGLIHLDNGRFLPVQACKQEQMSFRSSSSRVDDRTQSLNILLTRLRRSVSPQSSLEMQIR